MKEKLITNNCPICKNDYSFVIYRRMKEFCSEECKSINRLLQKDISRNDEIKSNLEQLKYGYDYVILSWNGMYFKSITDKIIKRYYPNKSLKDYKSEFPNDVIQATKYREHQEKGKHMKTEKFKKWARDKISGDKNPSKRRNKQSLKESSPFSLEYYKKRFGEEIAFDTRKEFYKTYIPDRIGNTSLEYWVNKSNGDIELGKKLQYKRQIKNGINYYVEKYGNKLGTEKYKDRIEKWKTIMWSKDNLGKGVSKMSNKFLSELITDKRLINKEFLFDKNEKWMTDNGKKYSYDFTCLENKKIIEVYGDFWHCNPNHKRFEDVTKIHPTKKITIEEVYKLDEYKNNVALKYGYDLLVIWEEEILKNKEETIEKAIKHMLG